MSNKYGENGFTLIEVLIAMVILSIALLGLSSMNLYTIQGNNFARLATAAVALAQDKIEALKNLSYTDAQLTDSNTGNDGSYTALQSTTTVDSQEANIDEKGNSGTGGTYTRVTNIANSGTGANSYANTKLIVVIVSWSDSSGSHSVTLTTMKGCKEFNAAGTCTG